MKKLVNKTNNYFIQIYEYLQKVFLLDQLISQFEGRRKFKSKNDEVVIFTIIISLLSGVKSIRGISNIYKKLNTGKTLSRTVLEDFLKIEDLPSSLRKFIKAMIKKMKRGKMINLKNVAGRILASVDGVETHRERLSEQDFLKSIENGKICKYCQVARKVDSKTGAIYYEVYHRLVVICIVTDRGPMPLTWSYQESDACVRFKKWLEEGAKEEKRPGTSEKSEEKLKQEGELTVLKDLLKELYIENNNKLPFDVIIGDGLYDKAPIIDLIEDYGAALIAVQKNEKRVIRQEAVDDFSTSKPKLKWKKGKKKFEGWQGVYYDINRKDENKQDVKIVRVIRYTKKSEVDNYFYCSNKYWIMPKFVEWCRYYRWKLENGFNAWTNKWELLKHMFHHNDVACDSILGFIFLVIIGVENFRNGNLKRGLYYKEKESTLEDFLKTVFSGLMKLKGIFVEFLNCILERRRMLSFK